MSYARNKNEILIVGTGYVGLVTAVGLAELGYNVACHDIDEKKIRILRQGAVPFVEPGVQDLLRKGIESKRLRFSSSLTMAFADQRYIFVAVPTPMAADGGVDLSALLDTITNLATMVSGHSLVIIKSTVPVGVFATLYELMSPEARQKIVLVSCPEFLSEGNAVHDFFHPRRVVVGCHDISISEEVAKLFAGLGGNRILTDANTAQMIKYGSNSFLATRVAFINEIAELCEALEINVSDVASALLMDPRLGHGYLTAGLGFAGPCLPKDVSALVMTAKRASLQVPLLSSITAQNVGHLRNTIREMSADLEPGDQVGVFGLSFKPHTDDVRNSFSLEIVRELASSGIHVRATDPCAIPAARTHISNNLVSFWDDPIVTADKTHRQIFLTPWDEYKNLDIDALANVVQRKSIFDAAGIFDPRLMKQKGFQYAGVGRKFGAAGPPLFICSNN